MRTESVSGIAEPAPPSVDADREARIAKRRVFRWGALLVALCSPLATLVEEHAVALMALNLLWALHIAAVGEALGRGLISLRRCGLISSAGGVLALMVGLHLTAHQDESYTFQAMMIMPLVVAAVAPDDRLAVLTFAGGAFAWLTVNTWTSGHDASHAVTRFVLLTASGCFALFVTHRHEWLVAARSRAIRERLALQEQLAESERRRAASERLAVIGQLAAGVAHEINNPLTYLLANLSVLRDRPEAPRFSAEERDEALSEVESGLLRIKQIVRDLQDFARRDGQGQDEECKVADAAAEALRLASVRFPAGTTVANHIPKEAPSVRITHQRMVQVLVNLLVNAADAMEPRASKSGAYLDLALEPLPNSRIRIVVEDSGPGITDEVLPYIFDPFFTTKPAGKGTGLGLALCREYVESAGGRIFATSRPAGGARFLIDLNRWASASP
jgi:signal transduction histidine kinase